MFIHGPDFDVAVGMVCLNLLHLLRQIFFSTPPGLAVQLRCALDEALVGVSAFA